MQYHRCVVTLPSKNDILFRRDEPGITCIGLSPDFDGHPDTKAPSLLFIRDGGTNSHTPNTGVPARDTMPLLLRYLDTQWQPFFSVTECLIVLCDQNGNYDFVLLASPPDGLEPVQYSFLRFPNQEVRSEGAFRSVFGILAREAMVMADAMEGKFSAEPHY